MKICSADAGILLLLASLFTNISGVFAQSSVNDSINAQKARIQQQFDFESVAKRLTGLSEPTIALPQKDSLSKRIRDKILNDLQGTHGHLDLSYAYGLNTVFIDTSRSIGSILTTSGDFSTAVLGMPVNLSFNYTTLKVPLGTNNYFRFSLDKDRLINQQKEKLIGSIANIEERQAKLQQKKAQLSEVMGYVEVCLDQLKRLAEREAQKRKAELSKRASAVSDTLQGVDRKRLDVENPVDYQLYYDSMMRVYQRITSLKSTYDSLSTKLASSKEMLSAYQAQLSSPDLVSKGLGKTTFLKSLLTFDVGLTYPKTTAMSGQNVPIKGVHIEMQFGKYYLSVTSGLTLNNIMLSTNQVQNELNYNQNVFNNFDFQQIINNGWLTAIKTGYGTQEIGRAHV